MRAQILGKYDDNPTNNILLVEAMFCFVSSLQLLVETKPPSFNADHSRAIKMKFT